LLAKDKRPEGVLSFNTKRIDEVSITTLAKFYIDLSLSIRKWPEADLNDGDETRIEFMAFVQKVLGYRDTYLIHLQLPLRTGSDTPVNVANPIIREGMLMIPKVDRVRAPYIFEYITWTCSIFRTTIFAPIANTETSCARVTNAG
jgi:hypothetical protein